MQVRQQIRIKGEHFHIFSDTVFTTLGDIRGLVTPGSYVRYVKAPRSWVLLLRQRLWAVHEWGFEVGGPFI